MPQFLLTLLLLALSSMSWAATSPKCADCHSNLTQVLPASHPAIKGQDIAACLACHQSGDDKASPNAFSAKLHAAHAKKGVELDCGTCHKVTASKSFSLPGRSSIGAADADTYAALREITSGYADGPNLDAIHAKKGISCAGCHGKALPQLDDKPTTERCLACHGSYEQLAAKTPGQDHASRNPHQSHLGPINCTVCHKAHQTSETYCLDCHRLFKMKPIPAGKPAGS
ncbi:MAG: cytochrome c3 family protein [Burkholderiaceae bacterium]